MNLRRMRAVMIISIRRLVEFSFFFALFCFLGGKIFSWLAGILGRDGVKVEGVLPRSAVVLYGAFYVTLLCPREVGSGE